MASPQDHRKISVFSELRLRCFAQYLEQNQVNEDWAIFWRYFAKQEFSSCETNENIFIDQTYGTLETAYHFHILHTSKIRSLVFSLSFLLQLHFVWLQEPDSLLTTQGSAISTFPCSNIRTSGWQLNNRPLPFGMHSSFPTLPSDSKMIRYHLTFLFRNR